MRRHEGAAVEIIMISDSGVVGVDLLSSPTTSEFLGGIAARLEALMPNDRRLLFRTENFV